MANQTMLNARRINHGQSEIWLGKRDDASGPRRTLATNEVLSVISRLINAEAFDAFCAGYLSAIGHTAVLAVPNLEIISVELRLRDISLTSGT